jgi:hypothetical protein
MEISLLNVRIEQEAPEENLPEALSFVLGRNRSGLWILQESHGLCGGMFATKDAAISYAKFESADRPSVIRLVAEPIELKCSY